MGPEVLHKDDVDGQLLPELRVRSQTPSSQQQKTDYHLGESYVGESVTFLGLWTSICTCKGPILQNSSFKENRRTEENVGAADGRLQSWGLAEMAIRRDRRKQAPE